MVFLDGLSTVEAALGLWQVPGCRPPHVPVPKPGPCKGGKRHTPPLPAPLGDRKATATRRRRYTGPRITVPAKDRRAFAEVRQFWHSGDWNDRVGVARYHEAIDKLGGDESHLVARARTEANVERSAAAFGRRYAPTLTLDQIKQQATDQVRRTFKNADLSIRVRPQTLEQVLTSGRFKNQFETGQSGGILNPDLRRAVEKAQFGLDDEFPDRNRPIYGYLSHADRPAEPTQHDVLTRYGQVQVVLKPQVRSRTTAMFGDSLANAARGIPSPLDEPSWESFTYPLDGDSAPPLQTMHRDLDGPEFRAKTFIEAQIHGGVVVDDIDRVILAQPPDPALRVLLAERGIPYTIRVPNPGPVTAKQE